MKYILLLILLISPSLSAKADYVWEYSQERSKVIFRKRDEPPSDKIYNGIHYSERPNQVKIDQECGMAYIISSTVPNPTFTVYDLTQGKQIDCYTVNARWLEINEHCVMVGCERYFKRWRSKQNFAQEIQKGNLWYLFTEIVFGSTDLNGSSPFDLMEFMTFPDPEMILSNALNECDLDQMVDALWGFQQKYETGKALFEKAISAQNPYAYALMYLAFKHGIWCVKESEVLAHVYEQFADQGTVQGAKNNLRLLKQGIGKGIGIID